MKYLIFIILFGWSLNTYSQTDTLALHYEEEEKPSFGYKAVKINGLSTFAFNEIQINYEQALTGKHSFELSFSIFNNHSPNYLVFKIKNEDRYSLNEHVFSSGYGFETSFKTYMNGDILDGLFMEYHVNFTHLRSKELNANIGGIGFTYGIQQKIIKNLFIEGALGTGHHIINNSSVRRFSTEFPALYATYRIKIGLRL